LNQNERTSAVLVLGSTGDTVHPLRGV
jgi:hypothetical protein